MPALLPVPRTEARGETTYFTQREREEDEIVYPLCISACTHHQYAHGPVFCLSIRIECSQRRSSLIFPASFPWKHTNQKDIKQPSLSPFSWDVEDGKVEYTDQRDLKQPSLPSFSWDVGDRKVQL